MAVAAADFYTYARATGTPLPQNKKEEAELVPAINQWKRNQLRQQRQEENNINGGAIAAVAGLAGLGAAALAASRGGLRSRVTNAVDPTSGSRVSTGVGGLQQDLNEKVTQSRNWDDYRDSIALKTQVDEQDFVEQALDKVEKDAIGPASIDEYTGEEIAALKAFTDYGTGVENNRIRRIEEGGEKVRQNIIRGLELPEPSWEQTSVVQNRQPEVRAISPKEVLALPPAKVQQEVEDPWFTQAITNNDVDSPITTNDFLQKQGPGKYIDPEKVTNNSVANVPKSTTTENQTISAIKSAEDQITGRIYNKIVTDPNVDTSNLDDVNLQNISENLPPPQQEQRVGVSKEQDFVEQALDQKLYNRLRFQSEELNRDELKALEGINWELKKSRRAAQPKPWENKDFNVDRIITTAPIKTGNPIVDSLIGRLPTAVVAAKEIAKQGAKDVSDAAQSIKKAVVENAPSNLPDFSRVPNSGINTSATVQLSDGSAAGPLYPFKQAWRGLTGGTSVDAVEDSVDAVIPKGKVIDSNVEGVDKTYVLNERDQIIHELGAKSDLPINTPKDVTDLSQTELSRFLQRQRYEIASQLRQKGEPITPGKIERELEKFYGPKSYDYVRKLNEELKQKGLPTKNIRNITKRKHALQLGATYDPKFFDNVNLKSVKIAGEDIPVIPSRRFTEAKTPYTGKAYLDDYSDSLKTPFFSEDTALGLAEQVEKKKNWGLTRRAEIESDIAEIYKERKIKAEQEGKKVAAQLKIAESKGQIGLVKKLSNQLENIRKVWKNPSLGYYRQGDIRLAEGRLRGIARKEIEMQGEIADLTVPLTVAEQPENAGKRVYFEIDTTGGSGKKIGKQLAPGSRDLSDEDVDEIDKVGNYFIDPESLQLRSEYQIKDTELKGGQGRKQAEALSPRPDNPLDTLVPLQQRGGTLFDRNTNTWKLMADIPENNKGLSRQTTRPVVDAIEPDRAGSDPGGLEESPRIFEDEQGGVTDIYGRRLASDLKDDDTVRPTQLVGKVKGPQTQKATAERRRAVNISENIRHLSDPNWLASKGYDLNKVSPKQLVGEYLQRLQSKTGSADLEEFLQTRGQSRPATYENTYTNLRGNRVNLNAEVEPSVTQTNVAQSSNYPAAQNQVNYVPPTESTIRSLSITPSEIEKAERMHLLNYISAAHGQIKGGARAGGTKMRNNLTPYQSPSDAMINQLVMKRRMERL